MNLPKKELIKMCKKYHIKLMAVFGSYGTDKFDKDSDIDIAILAEETDIIKHNKAEIVNVISALFDYRNVDVVLLNHADPLLKFAVAREGRLIYEKTPGLFNIFKVRAMSEHNDAEKFYKFKKEFVNRYIKGGYRNGKRKADPPEVR